MKKRFEELINNAKDLKMDAEDKRDIKNVLLQEMRNNRETQEERPSHGFSWGFLSIYRTRIAFVATFVFLLGGITSFAAENAMPDDFLYSVKTNFNEKMITVFSFGIESKAERETYLTERRLEEMKVLTSRDSIDRATTLDIDNRLTGHIERINRYVVGLEERGDHERAENINSRLDNALSEASQEMLGLTEEGEPSMDEEVDDGIGIASIDSDKADVDEEIEMEESEAQITSEDGLETHQEIISRLPGSRESAVNKIEEVREYLSRFTSRSSIEIIEQVESEIISAYDIVLEGDEYLKEGETNEASLSYRKAYRKAQQAKIHLNSRSIVENMLKRGDKEDEKEISDNENDRILEDSGDIIDLPGDTEEGRGREEDVIEEEILEDNEVEIDDASEDGDIEVEENSLEN